MPQASEELRAEWPGWDAEAIAYLESRGYTLERDWTWTHPTIKTHEAMEQREWSALVYLIHEWDFGGLNGVEKTDQQLRTDILDAVNGFLGPSCLRCSECEGADHHWLDGAEGYADTAPEHPAAMNGYDVWETCKHCSAWRPVPDDFDASNSGGTEIQNGGEG